MDSDIYLDSFFNVAREGNDWAIWRITNDDGDRETLILTTEAMDQLRDYFNDFYAEDRAQARAEVAADAEP